MTVRILITHHIAIHLLIYCATITKFVNPRNNIGNRKEEDRSPSTFVPVSTFQTDLKKLEQYLDTENATEVYLQREAFCDKVNKILELPDEHLRQVTAINTVKILERFSSKVDEYVRNSSIVSLHEPRGEFAWAITHQQHQAFSVTTALSNDSIQIKFNRGNDIDVVYKLEHNTEFHSFATLPIREFSGPEEKVVHTLAFRESTIFLDKESSIIASSVVSVAINDFTPKNLTSPIKLGFRKRNHTKGTFSCVHFEFGDGETLGMWSTSGCRKTKGTEHVVQCECNHLTNFALLLDVSQTGVDNFYLNILTWIGCSISLFGLISTIFIYTFVSSIEKSLGSKIVVRLCVSLVLLLIVFLAFAENKSKDDGDVFCMVASGFIHYFLLVTFMWMASEALSMYLLFVKPLEAFDQTQFLKKSTAASLLVPATIVIISGSIKPENLLDESFCLVRGLSFYFGVLTPIALILVFNMAVVLCCIISLSKPSLVSKQISLRQQYKITITMSVLLGGTWLFALFAVGMATIPFQIVFTVLTSLQGFFVFVLFVLLKKETREALRKWFSQLQISRCCRYFSTKSADKESALFLKSSNSTPVSGRVCPPREIDRLKRQTLTTSVSSDEQSEMNEQ